MSKIKEKVKPKYLIICIFIVLIIIGTFIVYKNTSTSNFRNVTIGMNKEKVLEIEKEINKGTDISTIYGVYMVKNAIFSDYEGNLVYAFDASDKLVNISYTIENVNKTDYNAIKDILKLQNYKFLIEDVEKEYVDATLKVKLQLTSELKAGKVKCTLSYDEIENSIVIYIQEYKENRDEK